MHNSLVMRIMVDGLGVVNNSLVMHYWGLVVDHWGVVNWSGMVALMVHWGNCVMTLVMDRSAVMNLGVVDWRDSVVRLSMVHNWLLEKNLSVVHVVLIIVVGRSTVHMGGLKRSLVSLEVGLLVNGGLGVMQNWSFNWGLVVHWFRVVALMVYWLRVVNDSLVMHRLRVVAFVMKHWLDSWFLEDSLVMSVMRFLVMDRLGVVHNSFMMHFWLGVVSLVVNNLMMGCLVVHLLSHKLLEKWLGNFDILDACLFGCLYLRFLLDHWGSYRSGLGWLLHIAHIWLLDIVGS